MNKHLIAIPAFPSSTFEHFSVHQERKRDDRGKWSIGDPDYKNGEKDAVVSPSIWSERLAGIEQEELLAKDKISNALEQKISEARQALDLFPALHEQNKQQIADVEARGELLPDVVARNMRSSARGTRIAANILLLIEMAGLYAVAKVTFGNGVLGAFCTAVLFVTIVAFLSKLSLSKASERAKPKLFWGFITVGGLLALTGMVGFAILRATTFNASLMGGKVDFGQLSLGNALLMVGLTLGVPLIIGALHDDATDKHTKANNSMDLYDDRKELQECESAWKRSLGKLEEYEKKVDPITESIIKDRKSSYRQGFHRGSAGKPEAAPYLKELMAASR